LLNNKKIKIGEEKWVSISCRSACRMSSADAIGNLIGKSGAGNEKFKKLYFNNIKKYTGMVLGSLNSRRISRAY